MKIYKIRGWVNSKKRRRHMESVIDHPYQKEEIYVKLEGAKNCYIKMKAEIKNEVSYAGVESAHLELFIPHVFKDGGLAYWPDKEKYIEKWEWPEIEDK